jgi:hypothetical protein
MLYLAPSANLVKLTRLGNCLTDKYNTGMNQRVVPYVFLAVLAVIGALIGGVRYGQHIEQTNRNTSMALSITPPKPSPTPSSISYLKYTDEVCGIEFIYPNTIATGGEHAFSASTYLHQGNRPVLMAQCDNSTLEPQDVKSTASREAMLKTQKIVRVEYGNGQEYYFSLIHPQTKKKIYFMVDKNLYPLFEGSLQFIPQLQPN